MKDKVLAKLFEGFDKQLLSEEVQTEVSALLDKMVEAKVAEALKQLQEKEVKLKEWVSEQNKILQEKEKALEEVTSAFAAEQRSIADQKEAICLESIKEFMEAAEKVNAEEIALVKEQLISVALEQCAESKKYMEEIAIEELKEHKNLQEAALAREVDAFKGKIVERVSEFMDTKFTEAIPAKIMEAAVQAAAYKPIVESMIKTFGKAYIQFDSTGHTAIKEAKEETEKLTESLNAKIKDNVRLAARVKDLEKATKINNLLEGLTAKQKERAKVLLERYELGEIEDAFKKIKEVVIEESVRKPAQQTVITETAKKQMQKLQESVTGGQPQNLDPEMNSWVNGLNRSLKG
jgi:hypothetical protein